MKRILIIVVLVSVLFGVFTNVYADASARDVYMVAQVNLIHAYVQQEPLFDFIVSNWIEGTNAVQTSYFAETRYLDQSVSNLLGRPRWVLGNAQVFYVAATLRSHGVEISLICFVHEDDLKFGLVETDNIKKLRIN